MSEYNRTTTHIPVQRPRRRIAHFDMLTFWDDIEAVKRFAGEDYAVAKYYEFDREFLLELEPHVRHHTVYDE